MASSVTKSGVATNNSALPILRRDPLLRDDNGGVVAMFDVGFNWGWPTGQAPHDGSVVPNLTEEDSEDLGFQLVAGQAVSYAGGGFDFAGLTSDPACIRGPAGMLAGIQAAQTFLMVMWMKLPAAVDWIPSSDSACYACSATSTLSYANGPDLLTIQPANPGAPAIYSRRQTTAINTYAGLSIMDLTGLHSTVCMIAAWRTASQTGLLIRGGADIVSPITRSSLAAQGALNVLDFSAQRYQWGVTDSLNNLAAIPVARPAHKHRIYRGWLENLAVSERDPLALIEREWAGNVARGAFF